MRIQDLAKEVSSHFETKTRTGDRQTFYSLKEGHPEWMQDLCRHAHSEMFPDDERYEMIHEVLATIANSDDLDDARDALEPSVYTADLLRWLSSHLERVAYVEQAVSDGTVDISNGFRLFEVISAGQMVELNEVFDLVSGYLEEHLEETEK